MYTIDITNFRSEIEKFKKGHVTVNRVRNEKFIPQNIKFINSYKIFIEIISIVLIK